MFFELYFEKVDYLINGVLLIVLWVEGFRDYKNVFF